MSSGSSIATTFSELQMVKPEQEYRIPGKKIVGIRVETQCLYLQDLQIINIPSTETIVK